MLRVRASVPARTDRIWHSLSGRWCPSRPSVVGAGEGGAGAEAAQRRDGQYRAATRPTGRRSRLARIAATSEYHLRRLFSALAGIGLSEYVRRRRLTVAAAEVLAGEQSLLDIAVRHGYGSAEAFGRAFQAVHGVSPGEARRRGRSCAPSLGSPSASPSMGVAAWSTQTVSSMSVRRWPTIGRRAASWTTGTVWLPVRMPQLDWRRWLWPQAPGGLHRLRSVPAGRPAPVERCVHPVVPVQPVSQSSGSGDLPNPRRAGWRHGGI